jgi:hypothetical protein
MVDDGGASRGVRAGAKRPRKASPAAAPRVFINYRHEDSEEAAVRMYDGLQARFGAENVFLDAKSLEPGVKWLEQIQADGARGSFFLALIGRTWLSSLHDRRQLNPGDPQDFVELELELALGKWSGTVIPVLVGRATMPAPGRLPKPIRALAGIQAMPLRPLSFAEDLEQLIARIDAGAGEQAHEIPGSDRRGSVNAERKAAGVSNGRAPEAASSPATTIPAPDAGHYETLLRCMVDQGSVVPVLGSGVRGSLPDADQLAAHLAERFGLDLASPDLAEVAQRVVTAEGASFLDRAIVEALTPQPEPNDTHRFLARFPSRLRAQSLPERYQMILTTNYDSALEQAFEAEGEEYDLAVFLASGTDASGTDKGKFLHVPWKGEPCVISETTKYREFPIDRFDELERTVIVKVHGAAEGGEGDYRWDGNYVLTEDQYIDYLVTDQIVRVIPNQILNKLTGSHCLFLGYAMHDWSVRVFLKRVWQGRPLKNRSWAIERAPDAVERDSWSSLAVELLASSPDDYVNQLDARMAARRASGG